MNFKGCGGNQCFQKDKSLFGRLLCICVGDVDPPTGTGAAFAQQLAYMGDSLLETAAHSGMVSWQPSSVCVRMGAS